MKNNLSATQRDYLRALLYLLKEKFGDNKTYKPVWAKVSYKGRQKPSESFNITSIIEKIENILLVDSYPEDMAEELNTYKPLFIVLNRRSKNNKVTPVMKNYK